MRIYVASPWLVRDASRSARDDLVRLGHVVTSRWLDAPEGPPIPGRERGLREAERDLADIDSADIFLVLTDERPIGAGHHVELGYAIAREKQIIVVGPTKSVFHYLAHHQFEEWPAALQHIGHSIVEARG